VVAAVAIKGPALVSQVNPGVGRRGVPAKHTIMMLLLYVDLLFSEGAMLAKFWA
jgi:hypothetical protein